MYTSGTRSDRADEGDGEHFYVQKVGEKERTELEVESLDTVVDELEEFAENVRAGSRPETGGPEALEVVAVFEGLVESAATGTVVDLDEVRARE